MPGTWRSSRWRFLLAPKWLAWHLFVLLSVLAMGWLGDWQLHRALSGNSLSWAYTFEWPLFAIFAVYFWVRTIRDEVSLPAATGQPDALALPSADDHQPAAYDAYLARLTKEVTGHGRWHGLR